MAIHVSSFRFDSLSCWLVHAQVSPAAVVNLFLLLLA